MSAYVYLCVCESVRMNAQTNAYRQLFMIMLQRNEKIYAFKHTHTQTYFMHIYLGYAHTHIYIYTHRQCIYA